MSVGENIRKIRKTKDLTQKYVAAEIEVGYTNYNKIETGTREASVKELQKLSSLFDMSIDQIVNFEGETPREITLEDKSTIEQMKLIKELSDEDKHTVFKIVDTMLTKKKFKDFFQNNIATL